MKSRPQVCHLFSNLWGEFKYQLLQQTFLTVLKDGDFRQSGEMHAHCSCCLKCDRKMSKNLIFPCDLSVPGI